VNWRKKGQLIRMAMNEGRKVVVVPARTKETKTRATESFMVEEGENEMNLHMAPLFCFF